MSLFRQIWFVIIVANSLLLVGFLYVGIIIAVDVLKAEQAKNSSDLAKYKALQISTVNLTEDNFRSTIINLLKSKDFESVKFTDTTTNPAKTLFESKSINNSNTPKWFMDFFPIDTQPAQQTVISEGRAIGVLEISKSKVEIYEALWSAVTLMVIWMLGGMIIVGILCNQVLRRLRKPIDEVIAQAGALSRREFIQIPESKVIELKPVTIAMNEMVSRIKTMFENEALRLDAFHKDNKLDKLTGLVTRESFMAKLQDLLIREDAPDNGMIVLLRFGGLIEANKKIGREATDTIMKKNAALFAQVAKQVEGGVSGRVNGVEYGLLLPNQTSCQVVMDTISKYSKAIVDVILPESEKNNNLIQMFLAVSKYNKGENKSQVLARLDTALANSEANGGKKWFEANAEVATFSLVTQEDWKKWFEKVLSKREIKLGGFPVKSSDGKVFHYESPVRLLSPDGNSWLSAGAFMSMAIRLKFVSKIDLEAINLAIKSLSENPLVSFAVNFSAQSFTNSAFITDLIRLLIPAQKDLSRLAIEITENDSIDNLDAFKLFCKNLKRLGVKIGVKQIGQNFGVVAKMQELGLNYIKLDGQLSHEIKNNPSNKEFILGVCSLVQGVGIKVIATGVSNTEDLENLYSLKVDAITGPAVMA